MGGFETGLMGLERTLLWSDACNRDTAHGDMASLLAPYAPPPR